MPDDQLLTPLPDATPSWLSRNRKIVILGGVVLILGLIGAAVAWWPRRTLNTTAPDGQTTITNNSVNADLTNTYSRPTFQRSIISNTSTTPPPVYRPPTTDDLRQAINNINSNNSSKP